MSYFNPTEIFIEDFAKENSNVVRFFKKQIFDFSTKIRIKIPEKLPDLRYYDVPLGMKLMDSEIQDILNPKKDKANLISLRQYWLYRYILQNTKLDPEKEYIFLFHILYRYNIFTVVLFYDDGKFRSIASYFNSNIHGHKPGTRLIY